MSRSRKHTPRSGDTKNRDMKRIANRRFRRQRDFDDTLQHNAYRKYSWSYDICDYETVGLTFEEYWRLELRFWHEYDKFLGKDYPSKEEARKYYEKWYLRK